MESPDTCAYSCFYLSFNGKRINEYMELGEIQDITTESELQLVEGKSNKLVSLQAKYATNAFIFFFLQI